MPNKKSKYILVCGGAGYIGAHMVWMLKEKGYKPVVFDNLSTGYRDFVPKGVPFIKGDLRRAEDIRKVFRKHKIDAVMHFAASSIVPESVKDPLKYYENNVSAAVNLLKVMLEFKVKKFIFSSTAAVYGEPKRVPIKETDPTVPKNPYGRSKLMIEQILEDCSNAYGLSYIALRYFNAAGAHPSGKIGERHDPETHLIPNILKVARGEKGHLDMYGNDYPTKDGTCIRDYIHVMDLAQAHLLALTALNKGIKREVFNLGNEKGFSIKDVLNAIEKVTGKSIKVNVKSRRVGDPAALVAKSSKAKAELTWESKHDLYATVETAWNFKAV